jgi:hypothetical protein
VYTARCRHFLATMGQRWRSEVSHEDFGKRDNQRTGTTAL